MSKIKCFKCKGKGKIVSSEVKVAVAFTVGVLFPLLFAKDTCDACDGRGWIKDD